jgi:hypothetical protein
MSDLNQNKWQPFAVPFSGGKFAAARKIAHNLPWTARNMETAGKPANIEIVQGLCRELNRKMEMVTA